MERVQDWTIKISDARRQEMQKYYEMSDEEFDKTSENWTEEDWYDFSVSDKNAVTLDDFVKELFKE